jgi:hypothetical protein
MSQYIGGGGRGDYPFTNTYNHCLNGKFFVILLIHTPSLPPPPTSADRGLCQDQWTILLHYKTFSIFQLFPTCGQKSPVLISTLVYRGRFAEHPSLT